MIGQVMECGGVKAVKCSKQIIQKLIKRYLEKHVAYHHFTIACIQYVVLIHPSEQVRMIELES